MLIETVVLALFIGFLRGGRLSYLAELHMKRAWLVILAFALQIAVYWGSYKSLSVGPSWLAPFLHTFSYFLLIWFALVNRNLPGMKLLILGICMNVSVIALNNGVMPVDPTYLAQDKQLVLAANRGIHGLLTDSSKLAFLADRLFISIPLLGKQIFSLGDIIIDISAFLLLFETMVSPRVYRIRSISIR